MKKLTHINWLILASLLPGLLIYQTAKSPSAPAFAQRTSSGAQSVFLPIITKSVSCVVPNATYNTIPIIPPATGGSVENNADINLFVRGYEPTSAALTLVEYGGGTDSNAPQLDTLFATPRVPNFTSAHQIYRWDWSCGCRNGLIDSWDTTLLGMGTVANETIHVPDSGYDIGGGNDVMVLYAAVDRITLKYTREDNVVFGYTVHIEDVCVDPNLVALYESLDAAGRSELPALVGGQPFGLAIEDEIKVSIRDAGSFLDPRSRKDWWQDY